MSIQSEKPGEHEVVNGRVRRYVVDGEVFYEKPARMTPGGSKLLEREYQSNKMVEREIYQNGGNRQSRILQYSPGNYFVQKAPASAVPYTKLFEDVELRTEHYSLLAGALSVLERVHGLRIDHAASPEHPVLSPIGHDQFSQINEGALLVLQMIEPELQEKIHSIVVKNKDRKTAFIHGDFSLDNIIAEGDGTRIIDWENAGMGDPHEDLAALLASFASWRILSKIRISSELNSSGAVLVREVSDELRKAAKTVGGSYQFNVAGDMDFLWMNRLIGLKLIARAQVRTHHSMKMTSLAKLFVHLGSYFWGISEPAVFWDPESERRSQSSD